MDDSAITCDEIIKSYDEETKIISRNFYEKKKVTCKTQIFYSLGHNILRLFDVLPSFLFTTFETNRDY